MQRAPAECVETWLSRNVGVLLYECSLRAQHSNGVVDHLLLRRAQIHRSTRVCPITKIWHGDSSAFECIRIQKLCIVTEAFSRHQTGCCCWIAGIKSRNDTQKNRGICDGARQGTSSVLICRDRDDAITADQSYSWFDTHNQVLGARTENGSRRFRSNTYRRKVCAHCDPGTRT